MKGINVRLKAAILSILFAVSFISGADARMRHRRPIPQGNSGWAFFPGFPGLETSFPQWAQANPRRRRLKHRRPPTGLEMVLSQGAETAVGHPRGCPSRSFCGCGASVRVFGRPIRSLWAANSWRRFPRSYPAPGRVAVRSHHVFVLERHIAGSVWQVYDANSGHHRTRVHPRSIAGYQIVDPGAG